MADWNLDAHPRDEKGRFTSRGAALKAWSQHHRTGGRETTGLHATTLKAWAKTSRQDVNSARRLGRMDKAFDDTARNIAGRRQSEAATPPPPNPIAVMRQAANPDARGRGALHAAHQLGQRIAAYRAAHNGANPRGYERQTARHQEPDAARALGQGLMGKPLSYDLAAKEPVTRDRLARRADREAAKARAQKAESDRAAAENARTSSVEDFQAAGIRVSLTANQMKEFHEHFEKSLGFRATPQSVKDLAGLHGAVHENHEIQMYLHQSYNGISIDAAIMDKTTNQRIGRMVRGYHRGDDGKVYVHHELLQFHVGERAAGIGKAILKNQVGQYVKHGFDRVELDAAWDGQYVWPHMGFDAKTPRVLDEIKSEFRHHLETKHGVKSADSANMMQKINTLQEVAHSTHAGEPVGKKFLLSRGNEMYGDLIAMKAPLHSGSPLRTYLGV
jgi:hypothetical protein